MRRQLRPDAARLVEQMETAAFPQSMALSEIREAVRANCFENDLPAENITRCEDLVISGGSAQPLSIRLYADRFDEKTPSPVIAFFHGGGWMVCDLDTHHSLCTQIARSTGWTVISVDYRRAPEHRFPAALDDAIAALHWIAESPGQIPHPVNGIIVAGDSAGGTLAAGCADLGRALKISILAQWIMYAGTDMVASGGSADEFGEGHILTRDMMAGYRNAYFEPSLDPSAAPASPLYAADFASLPPALIFAAECDPLRDQSRAFAAKLINHGVSVRYREAKGQVHGCFVQRRAIPSAHDELLGCVDDLVSLVRETQHQFRGSPYSRYDVNKPNLPHQ